MLNQILVNLKWTDGNNEYNCQVILTHDTLITHDSSFALARKWALNNFPDMRQDRKDSLLLWDRGDVRNVMILKTTILTDAEFDFLKHFLDVTSVP